MHNQKELRMRFGEFMAKVREWDNRSAKWMMRHFYILFFEAFLVAIFVGLFMNTLQVINISDNISRHNVTERLLLSQSVNSLIIVLLLLLNSFWMLYMFNSMIRFRSLLKEINFNLRKNARS